RRHTLFQALTRTNRRWTNPETGQEKTAGLIVDYIGLGKQIAEAMRVPRKEGEREPLDTATLVDELVDELGGVDVFVNNAGGGHSASFLEHGADAWQHVLDVDLTGAFLCMQAAARRMVGRGGGRIIAVTSVHEHVPLARSVAYCAAKGGLGLVVKVAALELAEHGITVNAIAPGEISTKMTGQQDEDPTDNPRPGIPLGRPGHAAEVAHAIRWLASPEASYVTGESFVVDGGLLLMAAQANSLLA
ncbi:MAG TPA: SDR family oxidoreductase, partial [Nitriliruptorales bacterium]|nr:SDR family oxidoreductase [Nitriliruptorales bacterium]